MSEIPERLVLCVTHRQVMLDHVQACLPEEGCGLICGRFTEAGPCGEAVLPVANQLRSPVRFFMEPLELLKALTWIEDQGLELVAIFHSHPAGPPGPSETDLVEFAYPGVLYLVLSPESGLTGWRVGAYWIEAGGRVAEVALEWDEGC